MIAVLCRPCSLNRLGLPLRALLVAARRFVSIVSDEGGLLGECAGARVRFFRLDFRLAPKLRAPNLLRSDEDEQWDHTARLRGRRIAFPMDVSPSARMTLRASDKPRTRLLISCVPNC